jgi:hypothetical protein
MSDYEPGTRTKRAGGVGMREDLKVLWRALEVEKADLEKRIAAMEAEHWKLVGQMHGVAQEARANGITLSRQAWVRLPMDP